jgi:hypothetical protein
MIAAIAGLSGVVIGGLLGFLAQWLTNRQKFAWEDRRRWSDDILSSCEKLIRRSERLRGNVVFELRQELEAKDGDRNKLVDVDAISEINWIRNRLEIQSPKLAEIVHDLIAANMEYIKARDSGGDIEAANASIDSAQSRLREAARKSIGAGRG